MAARHALRYLRRAQEDLLGIVDYIARDDPAAAKRFVSTLDAKLGRLGAFPRSGKLPRDARLKAKGYRMLVFGEYLAFYRVVGDEVRVYRVIHGRRRYEFLV